MAAEKNLVYACVFFILFNGVSASDFSGFFDQIKEVGSSFNISDVGDLINEAVVPGSLFEKGQDLFKKGQDLLKQARQGSVSLDTIVGMLPKDANGKATAASSLNKLGLSVREVVNLAGLGKNEHVARVAEQFISDPQNLDEGGKMALCEGLKASVEEKPEMAGGLQMLGMDTNVICANSAQLKTNLALVLTILLVNITAVIW